MKPTIPLIALGLALCSSALAQSPPMDLVQAEFDSIPRKAVPLCPNSKRVNIFIRLNNSPTSVIDAHAAKTGKFLFPKLVGPWEKELETQLKDAGYCIYFAPLFADVETLEAAPYDQGFRVGGLHLNPLMAYSPSETSTELEKEPPYVLVTLSPQVSLGVQENVAVTIRNRWVGYTPEIVYVPLWPANTHSLDKALLREIDWTANRIPRVKSRIYFEGKELPATQVCQLPPPTLDEVRATDLNWEKSADAACNVSPMYFDKAGHMNKCSGRKK